MRSKLIVLLLACVLVFSSMTVLAQNGVLTVALQGKAQTLDPAFLKRSISEWPIMNSIFNGLVKYKPGTFEVVPDLAADWQISDDNKEITFHLRKGVQFHKGYGEFTAEDVKFSFERIIDPEKDSPEASSFANLKEVQVVDDYTVKLIMSEPMARLFTSTLPFNAGLIVSKKAVEEMGKDKFAHNPIGTGPYVFSEWGVNNDITLVKNDNYWGDKAEIAEVNLIPMPNQTSQEMALQSGDIDLGQVTLDNIDKMKANSNLKVKVYPDLAIQWISFNVKKAPMDNIYLRKALRYIINPQEILLGAFAGQGEKANSILLPDMLGYWKAPVYSLDEVGKEKVWELLEKAGYPQGKGLELEYLTDANNERRMIATIIQAQLAKFNIKLNIKAVEIGPKIEGWHNGDYHITYARFTNTVDPGYCLQWFLTSQIGKWNLMHWSDKKFDQLWNKAEVTMDNEQRADLYVEMQKIMDRDAIGIWVTHGVRTPTWRKGVEPVFQPDGVILPWLTTKK